MQNHTRYAQVGICRAETKTSRNLRKDNHLEHATNAGQNRYRMGTCDRRTHRPRRYVRGTGGHGEFRDCNGKLRPLLHLCPRRRRTGALGLETFGSRRAGADEAPAWNGTYGLIGATSGSNGHCEQQSGAVGGEDFCSMVDRSWRDFRINSAVSPQRVGRRHRCTTRKAPPIQPSGSEAVFHHWSSAGR